METSIVEASKTMLRKAQENGSYKKAVSLDPFTPMGSMQPILP
jgi:hypothetical protein